MLDIHRQLQQPQIEVRSRECSVDVGRLDASTFISDIHAARRALASTIVERLFLKEQETEFEFLFHFDLVDECESYLLAEDWYETEADEALIESIRELLPPRDGEILMRVPVLATRLKRLG